MKIISLLIITPLFFIISDSKKENNDINYSTYCNNILHSEYVEQKVEWRNIKR